MPNCPEVSTVRHPTRGQCSKCDLGDPRPAVTNYVTTHQINEGTYPSLAVLIGDIAKQIQSYGSLAKIPAAAVGNTRNDMYLTSEAIRFLQKDKENDLSKAGIAPPKLSPWGRSAPPTVLACRFRRRMCFPRASRARWPPVARAHRCRPCAALRGAGADLALRDRPVSVPLFVFSNHRYPGCADAAACASRRLRPIRSTQ
jgi:hypothetical protein